MARNRPPIEGQSAFFGPETSGSQDVPKQTEYSALELAYPNGIPDWGNFREAFHRVTRIQMEPLTEEKKAELKAQMTDAATGEQFLGAKLELVMNNPHYAIELAEREVFHSPQTGAPTEYGYIDHQSVIKSVFEAFKGRFDRVGYIGKTNPVVDAEGHARVSGKKVEQERALPKIYINKVLELRSKAEAIQAGFALHMEQISRFLDEFGPSFENKGKTRLELSSISDELRPAVKVLFKGEKLRQNAGSNFEAEVLDRITQGDDAKTQMLLVLFAAEFYDGMVKARAEQLEKLIALQNNGKEFERGKTDAITASAETRQAKREAKKLSQKGHQEVSPEAYRRGTQEDPDVQKARQYQDEIANFDDSHKRP